LLGKKGYVVVVVVLQAGKTAEGVILTSLTVKKADCRFFYSSMKNLHLYLLL